MSPSGNNAPCVYMEVGYSFSKQTNFVFLHNHMIMQWWWSDSGNCVYPHPCLHTLLSAPFSSSSAIHSPTFRWESQPWPTACGPLSLAKQTPCWAFANMIHDNIHLQCSIKLLLLLWVHETLVEYVGINLCHSQTNLFNSLFIGPESDHWQPLSLTDSLTTKG